MKNKKLTNKALTLSVCLLLLWMILGTSTTVAWFTDTTPVAKNSFIIGELDLKVSYKNDVVTEYTPVDSETSIFNDEAIYEPGYTQVVYLKIENAGEIDFDYKLSVDRNSYVDSLNVYGLNLHLPDYLRFGVVFADSEPSLDRELAQGFADIEMNSLALNQYSKLDEETVAVGETRYAALIVFMPEEVGNEANFRGDVVPQVDLGITVFAQQAGAPMEE